MRGLSSEDWDSPTSESTNRITHNPFGPASPVNTGFSSTTTRQSIAQGGRHSPKSPTAGVQTKNKMSPGDKGQEIRFEALITPTPTSFVTPIQPES